MNSKVKSKNAIKILNWENIGNINHGGLFGLKVQAKTMREDITSVPTNRNKIK